jgi:hypothetical protein
MKKIKNLQSALAALSAENGRPHHLGIRLTGNASLRAWPSPTQVANGFWSRIRV